MSAGIQSRPAVAITSVGRHWGWMLAFGIVTLAAGICALIWPGITLIVWPGIALIAAAIIFGIQLIVTGIYRLAAALASDEVTGGTQVLLALLGVLSLIVGLYAVGTCCSLSPRLPSS